jgi:hypothetical protein
MMFFDPMQTVLELDDEYRLDYESGLAIVLDEERAALMLAAEIDALPPIHDSSPED